MITGSFDQWRRPYVQGRLVISRLNIDGYIDFLVDTGADTTCFHPGDGKRLGLPFPELRNPSKSEGIGGEQVYYQEQVRLIFADGRRLRIYVVEVGIAKPDKDSDTLPSILGQDILRCWDTHHAPAQNRLDFRVRLADATVRIRDK